MKTNIYIIISAILILVSIQMLREDIKQSKQFRNTWVAEIAVYDENGKEIKDDEKPRVICATMVGVCVVREIKWMD